MSAIQIVCTNCGAKYRLPETFKGDHAKCKACGATIDVSSQLPASSVAAGDEPAAAGSDAAKPTAAKPASAKPARARPESSGRSPRRAAARGEKPADDSTASGRSARRAGGARPTRRGRRGAEAEAASEGDEDTGRPHGRRGARASKKSNTGVMIGSAIALVAVVVVVLVFALKGGDGASETQDTAKAGDGAAAAQDAQAAAAKAAAQKAEEEAAARVAEAAQKAKEAEAAKAKEAATAAETAKAAEAAAAKPEEMTRDQVFDPKTLEPLEWPEYVTEAERAEILELLAAVKYGGAAGNRAKAQLEDTGHKCLVGLINVLRELDYLDASQSMTAFELNRMLESMTLGMNAGFKGGEIQLGEPVPFEVADFNARTVKLWQGLPRKYPTAEAWRDWLKERRDKQK